jgi:long-chain acyl-CoA synthetase
MPTQTESARRYDAPPLAPFAADTVPKLFFGAVDARPTPRALLHREAEEWRPLSTVDVERRVARLAAALASLGVERGDRVAILSENRPEWAIADYAVLGLGAVDVPVYATLPAAQVAYILEDSGAKAILVSTREQLEKIREIRAELPALAHVIAFDDPGTAADVVHLPALLERGRAEIEAGRTRPFREQALAAAPEDLATLIYTSGTTGNPKGVMLTHLNLASNVAAVEQHRVFVPEEGAVALSFLPLSHAFERLVDYYYWYFGFTIAYAAMDRIAEAMVELRPHVLAAAPRVFEKIYGRVMGATGVRRAIVGWAKRVGEAGVEERLSGRRAGPEGLAEKLADRLVYSKLRARTGGRLRAMVSGSAPLSADIARFFWAAGMPVYEGYGLTETSPVLTVNRPAHVRLGTVGQPVPGTELRIGDGGEILARGPQIMKGYWQRPDATAEEVDEDGWFHTGDVGELDADGYLRITDRIKNLIVTAGGKNIAPQPIENEVVMSPYIAQVVMLGDRRAFPSLLVVPDFENLRAWAKAQGITATDPTELARDPRVQRFIEQEALARLGGFAHYETPKKVALIPDEFTIEAGELTPTLKVKRRVVEDHYRDLIETLYEGH